MKPNAFEKSIPDGYTLDLHIDATDKKFGLVMNAVSLGVIAIVMAVTVLLMQIGGGINISFDTGEILFGYLLFIGGMIAYIILHELTHGIAYKLLTKERLTFGIKWSCAFCGVPSIYVSRRAALIAVAAPLVVFTLLLTPLTVFLYRINHLYCLICAFILGMHLGGCSGDGYVIYLFLTKYRDRYTLMRDTGPEQFFYIKGEGDDR